MHSPIVLASVAFASVAATSHHFSATERATLTADVHKWQQKFAKALPYVVPKRHGLSGREGQDDLLGRMKTAKDTVADLHKRYPGVQFSYMSRFALWTPAEFKAYVNKAFRKHKPSDRHLEAAATNWASLGRAKSNGTVDWATSKCMNPVEDQGKCGSCWAFSAASSLETAHCIATGTLLDLSEQQLVSCAKNSAQDFLGCEGGWEDKALGWVHDNGGLCLAKDYPYTSGPGQTGTCETTCTKHKLSAGAQVYAKGEQALEAALKTQPVTVTLFSSNDAFRFYQSGVLPSCPEGAIDHAVLAVGYGSENGKDYFKVRNSWGTDWGEKGHIRLARGTGGKGTCYIAELPAYPQIMASPTSDPTSDPTTVPTPSPSSGSGSGSTPTDSPTDNPTEDPTDAPTDGPAPEGKGWIYLSFDGIKSWFRIAKDVTRAHH